MKTLIIFLKYPTPGTVKTRLAGSIGFIRAAQVYEQLVQLTLEQIRLLSGKRIVLYFDPPEKIDDMKEWLGEEWDYVPQEGSGLGERLQNAITSEMNRGAKRVVVVGTDIPEIRVSHLKEAFVELESTDVVVGPAHDGGYYLIGVNKGSNWNPLFETVDWSTDEVLEQTKLKLDEQNLSCKYLETLRDVDTEEDLAELNQGSGVRG